MQLWYPKIACIEKGRGDQSENGAIRGQSSALERLALLPRHMYLSRTVLSSQTVRYCQESVQDLSGNSLVMETSASSADLVSEAGTLWSA